MLTRREFLEAGTAIAWRRTAALENGRRRRPGQRHPLAAQCHAGVPGRERLDREVLYLGEPAVARRSPTLP